MSHVYDSAWWQKAIYMCLLDCREQCSPAEQLRDLDIIHTVCFTQDLHLWLLSPQEPLELPSLLTVYLGPLCLVQCLPYLQGGQFLYGLWAEEESYVLSGVWSQFPAPTWNAIVTLWSVALSSGCFLSGLQGHFPLSSIDLPRICQLNS